jgi:ATP-binding cassette subfamily C (CFTR/MRP) protein 4
MGYAIGLFLVTLFHGTMHHHYFFPTMRTGLWIRQSVISLMYRKCLALSTSSSIATGTIVNLISNGNNSCSSTFVNVSGAYRALLLY